MGDSATGGGSYKGLIYCLSLTEALEISNQVNMQIQKNIRLTRFNAGKSEMS